MYTEYDIALGNIGKGGRCAGFLHANARESAGERIICAVSYREMETCKSRVSDFSGTENHKREV